MPGRHRRRRANLKPTLGQRCVFVGHAWAVSAGYILLVFMIGLYQPIYRPVIVFSGSRAV